MSDIILTNGKSENIDEIKNKVSKDTITRLGQFELASNRFFGVDEVWNDCFSNAQKILDFLFKVEQYVHCFAQSSGQISFMLKIPGGSTSEDMIQGGYKPILDQILFINNLIDKNIFGVDQFGNLRGMPNWISAYDEIVFGQSFIPIEGILLTFGTQTEIKLPGDGKIIITFAVLYTEFCFDDKATDKLIKLIASGAAITALAAEFGIPAIIAAILGASAALIEIANLISNSFGIGGFYLYVSAMGSTITPRLS